MLVVPFFLLTGLDSGWSSRGTGEVVAVRLRLVAGVLDIMSAVCLPKCMRGRLLTGEPLLKVDIATGDRKLSSNRELFPALNECDCWLSA